jgi:hypothetical protein
VEIVEAVGKDPSTKNTVGKHSSFPIFGKGKFTYGEGANLEKALDMGKKNRMG